MIFLEYQNKRRLNIIPKDAGGLTWNTDMQESAEQHRASKDR